MNTFDTHNDEVAYMPHRHFNHDLPEHLQKYVVEQNYEHYTAEDQAAWRFIMSQLIGFLKDNAHPCYIEGLQKTGISLDSIPHIEDINEKLNKFGWGAVPVSGFIPPAAFMEFQSRGFLPIASDMRTLDHLLYTPAPDIVHEAAGHAPILVDPEFASYLKEYAKVAANAIISKEDLEQYRLIRKLSDLKELPGNHSTEVAKTETELNNLSKSIKNISEAGYLSRMNWWTAEYGLIGPIESPKIFGAGLLSSLGEAQQCLSDKVTKLPLSLDCVNYSYDITEPQPQLFVAESFTALTKVLHELSENMAFNTGGIAGLEKAKIAESINSVELNTGLQISGVLTDYFLDENEHPIFLKFSGPSQLSYLNKELKGHGKDYHSHGYSSPIGYIKGFQQCLSSFTNEQLKKLGLVRGQETQLDFESGVCLKGLTESITFRDNKLIIIGFKNCLITYKDKVLFAPEWGNFDLAIGHNLPSIFGGPADRLAFGDIDKDTQATRVPERIFTDQEIQQQGLFEKIKELRSSQLSLDDSAESTKKLIEEFSTQHSDNWLLGVELLECANMFKLSPQYSQRLIDVLKTNDKSAEVKQCIIDGMALLNH